MAGVTPVRLIRNEFELQDLVDSLGRDSALVEQDFALMTIAAGLVAEYGDALCFKGGFVLRHVHGHERFSKDIDATRINPPKNKLDLSATSDRFAPRARGSRHSAHHSPGRSTRTRRGHRCLRARRGGWTRAGHQSERSHFLAAPPQRVRRSLRVPIALA